MEQIIIAIALWCGHPEYPRPSVNDKINKCRIELSTCLNTKSFGTPAYYSCFTNQELK